MAKRIVEKISSNLAAVKCHHPMAKKKNNDLDILEKCFRIIALGLLIIGLGVFVWFITELPIGYKYWNFGVNFDLASKIGDFLGGVVGTIWSLAGILLFFLALRLQRKDLSQQIEFQQNELKEQRNVLILQQKELKNQRIEFSISRYTNIVYKQIDRIDNFISLQVFKYKGNEFTGIIGIQKLNQFIDEAYINDKRKSTIAGSSVFNELNKNFDSFYQILHIVKTSYNLISKIDKEVQGVLEEEMSTSLFELYEENLQFVIKETIEYFKFYCEGVLDGRFKFFDNRTRKLHDHEVQKEKEFLNQCSLLMEILNGIDKR